MGLRPYALLTTYVDRDFFDILSSASQVVAWNLAAQIGGPDVAVDGFVPDASGSYLIQSPVFYEIDADETAWTPGGGDTGLYTHATDPSTGAKFLCQKNAGAVSNTTFSVAHFADVNGGFRVAVGRPASPTSGSAYNWYLELSRGSGANAPQLRLAIEAGNPIRLDVSTDNAATWTQVDIASDAGESDAYLDTVDRQMVIDVIPDMDLSFWSNEAFAQTISDQPPDRVQVLINGSITLTYNLAGGTFPAGNVGVAATAGQWTLAYGVRQYEPSASMLLPEQLKSRAFATNPVPVLSGYRPYGLTWNISPIQTRPNGCAGLLTLTSPPQNIDMATGKSTCTAILSSAILKFPPVFIPRSYGPAEYQFDLSSISGFLEDHALDQARMMRRSGLRIVLTDSQKLFAPGLLKLAVRAATFDRGWIDSDTGATNIVRGLTGLTSHDEPDTDGYSWWYDGNKQFCVGLEFSDCFRNDVACEDLEEMDGQCQYHAMRECGYRQGFSDDRMPFPFCNRDSGCNHYHLPRGTTFAPLFRPHPAQSVTSFMLQIRAAGAEFDDASGQTLPMMLLTDTGGNLQFVGMPYGVVNTWLNPDQWPSYVDLQKIYTTVPEFDFDGEPVLNEILSGLRSSANLASIRTAGVFEGLGTDGGFVLAWFNDPLLDGGLLSDPNAPGYVGIPKPYIDISKLYNTIGAATTARDLNLVQMSFPKIKSEFVAHLQPDAFPADTLFGIQEAGTQGTLQTVPYYNWRTTNRYRQQGQKVEMESQLYGRLLGQVG